MDVRERDVEDLFYKYGRIRDVELKTPSRPPAYAFITFEDDRDAEDAVRARNGYDYDGHRLRVEFSRGKDGPSSGRPGSRDGFRDDRGRVVVVVVVVEGELNSELLYLDFLDQQVGRI